MVAGILNFKNYVIISLVISGILFLIGLAFHTQISSGLTQLNRAAMAAGMSSTIANVVTEPMRAAFVNGAPGALVAGFLWPVTSLWLIFIFALFFFSVLGSGFNTAANTIRN